MLDNIGLFDHLPISGNEKITVKFYSYKYDPANYAVNFMHRTFDVLKIKNITSPNDYSKRYTLVFASPELKRNETIRLSKAFIGQKISDVVKTIMTDSYDEGQQEPKGLGFPSSLSKEQGPGFTHITAPDLSPGNYQVFETITDNDAIELFIENTKYIEPYITIPYMKPFDIIRWLSGRAIRQAGLDKTSANFLFFENKRGYQYVSLTTLLENQTNNNATLVYGDASQNVKRDWTVDAIESFHIENCYNVLSNIKHGMYASRLYTYEISTGQATIKDYDYIKSFPNNESVDGTIGAARKDHPVIAVDDNINPLTQKPLSKRMLLPIGSSRAEDTITSTSTSRFSDSLATVGSEEYIQARISQLAKLVDFRVIVEISGNSQHKVGDIINLDLKMWAYDKDDVANTTDLRVKAHKYYSGNYLITSIKHVLNNFEYKMQLELVKDSLLAKLGK